MTQLGQSSKSPDWRPYCSPIPKWHPGSSLSPSDMTGLIGLDQSTRVRLKTVPEAVGGTGSGGGLIDFGARATHMLEFHDIPLNAASVPSVDIGFDFGTRISAQPQLGPSVNVSDEAESFARKQGLWGSLIVLKSLILGGRFLFLSVTVELVSDAEISGRFAISFNIRTNAELLDVLDFDERIRGQAYDQLPMDDQIYFAVRFEFE